MKYEVIGWTHAGNEDYPPHGSNTCSVDNAVIKEILMHGYLFGGDVHEDYCPVLNDGTYASYSSRNWGRIMAIAHDENNDDGLAYSLYFMDSRLKPECRRYPHFRAVDERRIVHKEALTETFTMHLDGKMFEAMEKGEKTAEIRLFDERRKLVDIGDYIEFRKKGDEWETVLMRVTDIHVEKTFEKLFERNVIFPGKEWDRPFGFTPKQLGAKEDADINSLVKGMYKYYNKNQEKKYGVIAFELEDASKKPSKKAVKHSCTTYFMFHNKHAGEGITDIKVDEDLSSSEKFEAREKILEQRAAKNREMLKVATEEFGEADWYLRQLTVGMNSKYNVNVNEMLRVTLKNLFGKEEKLREFQKKFSIQLILQIVPQISAQSKEPKQILSLESDIIDFLHKSGAKVDIDYYII